MANRKTPPAQIVGESLGPMSDQDRAELAAGMRAVALTVTEADKQFGDGQEYSLDRCLEMVDVNTTILERATLQIGRYFNWMKEREPHGAFTNAIETRTKYSVRSAQVFMGLSRALCAPDGEPIPLIQYLSSNGGTTSKSKLIELSYLHPDDLARLGAGEEVKGVTREQIKVMTAREVAEAFAAKDAAMDAKTEELAKRADELEAADREIRRLKRGGKDVEESNYVDAIAEANADADAGSIDVANGLAKLASATALMSSTEVPAHADATLKHTRALKLYQDTLNLARAIAGVLRDQEAAFAKYIEKPLNEVRGLDDDN